ncbi:MAG: hypothetical protein PHV56_01740 [Clostridia bacterium]|nr:hypothetical protein [Clostridia bacterium]
MAKSIWFKDGVSIFPVEQPMVGQVEFYQAFKEYLKDLKSAPMARFFIEIGIWGVGKSRTAYEIISESMGISKGWIIRNKQGELEDVRLLQPDLIDGILPVYLRYSQMNNDYLYSDNWVAYGAYVALGLLAQASPLTSIQGTIFSMLQDQLIPAGFEPEKLKQIIEKGKYEENELLSESSRLDGLVEKGLDYLKEFGIQHLMIIVDEIETEMERAAQGIVDDDEAVKKLDGAAIKVITSAIKHEDSRSRHPRVSFLLLCSTGIGDQIRALEALDRRGEIVEISQNSYADIDDFVDYLQNKKMLRTYPTGLLEAAYTIAGGNFGWMNVLMSYCDQYLDENPDASAGETLEDRAVSVSRIKDRLIDNSQFQYLSVAATDPKLPAIKRLLFEQLPKQLTEFSSEMQKLQRDTRLIDGTPLFREFISLPLNKSDIGMYLNSNGYTHIGDNEFRHESSGEIFNLEVLLRSLATFSITAPPEEYIVGKDKDIFLEQIRMLYPKDGTEGAAFIIYDYIQEQAAAGSYIEYVGPNFAFLERMNRRYATKKGLANYLLKDDLDISLKEHLTELKKDQSGEIKRILAGFSRVLEMDYPQEDFFPVNSMQGLRTRVSKHIYLGTHPDNKLDIIWDDHSGKLKDVLSSKQIVGIGAHPVIVLSLSAITEEELNRIKEQIPGASRYVIFFHLTNSQKEVLEVVATGREWADIRENAHQLAPQFQTRVRAIRDEVSKKSRAWFENLDKQGFILRPIIFTKSEEDSLPYLAEGYGRMLRYQISVAEIGANIEQMIKMPSEEFIRFERAIAHTLVRIKMEKEGYKDTGIFIDESGEYQIQIPAALPALLQFIGTRKMTFNQIKEYFFFSSVDIIKPQKIVEQWMNFLYRLRVIELEDGNTAVNIISADLEVKLDKVELWLKEDYDALVDSFKGIITDGKIMDLHSWKLIYQKSASDARTILHQLNLKQLQTTANMEIWREQLTGLISFHGMCDYIYDPEKYISTAYSENRLQDLRMEDKDIPIWERLCLVERFHEYIGGIQAKILERINTRMTDIKEYSSYRDYTMPISPFTNILSKYMNEIEFARDYTATATKATVVEDTETLAAKLWFADYKGAVQRLRTVLTDIGMGQETYEWHEEKGIIGIYNQAKKQFIALVDGYLDNNAEVKKWLAYFQDAPARLANDRRITQLDNTCQMLELFLTGGFDQDVDDREMDLTNKPMEFIRHMEGLLNEHKSDIASLIGKLNELKSLAKNERNKVYDIDSINALNMMRKLKKQHLLETDNNSVPAENSYQATHKATEKYMKEVEAEGKQFFVENKTYSVTFEFFKDVVKQNADLEWTMYEQEKLELESIGLIKTKVMLI